ncbi:MAG TPA: iron-sulfur cluster co-chaperone HscB C-terminal domain-containing protein [Chitinophagaceae bacterium]|jgi:molecular chaperone HscB|nr:iron-sulfur cluster co-chaperone HscB C-terminal domain-containing protein [Chitinophagaceae bacterium]HMU58367.1 iron-sulfur cluster co-chaperone HscB C-terminal domain-containing protein [Chitinophagaceae bacterium]
MNYFDIFQIPVQLIVNPAELTSKYFELSRQFHPDFYINETEEKQQEALEKTALLNKALKTFQNPDETLKYVLQLKGLMTDDEKYQLPPVFLMEVMEINESLMDDAGEDDSQRLQERIAALQNEIYSTVKPIIEGYKDGEATKEQLLAIKEYYFKKKYIDRIKKELQDKN